MSNYVVQMLNIRKTFPKIIANDDVTLRVKKGEVHAILGENGAGKSTLMSILFGLYHADSGKILINEEEVKIRNPKDADFYKIGMVHQHFKLVDNYSVTENIILGNEGSFFLNREEASKKIKKISEQYGLNIDPNQRIDKISVGMQQRVEILKMLYRDAKILIFDEPTAVLTPQEINELITIMRNLVKEGKSIILITHKLQEIKEIADRCTIIRKGKLIDVVDVKETSEQEMADMMVGRAVNFKLEKEEANLKEVVLELNNLNVLNNKKVLGVKDLSLKIRAGEIVGIAGVDGNGQSELVEAITGLCKIESGEIKILGEGIQSLSIRDRNEKGIGHIPEDRQKRGLVLDYSIYDNMALKTYYQKPFSQYGFLNKQDILDFSEKISKLFDVRSAMGVKSIARNLSGGNQQKAILAREISLNPKLLIAVQPTRGLDVGAIEYIHKMILKHRDAGNAVLLVSFELDEIFNLSDRIIVLHRGVITGERKPSETNEGEIGLMMAGYKDEK